MEEAIEIIGAHFAKLKWFLLQKLHSYMDRDLPIMPAKFWA